ncbi:TcmI family type II polyketide cyclase [Kineosporia babensis]|uniref:TcmI family type II polyketide cyclase n=1 Tax=Kineosporia babensis TaxID=499548 RepID=A0A9X1SX07_9ACTN|nr:TcmI family type II polyketide cyclase [Kineosporia babensis]MCD5315687.1 TcmI family type II polyketide cyclase [Kineosporia babensis]
MHSTLIVGRMRPESAQDVAQLFADFDRSDLPHRMGTRRRELFTYQGLYFHLQDFSEQDGGHRIQQARTDPRFVRISDDLKPFIEAFDPATWRSPADALASRFYHWQP